MARRNLLYEGKAKILYEGEEEGTLIQYFKDDVTAFNSKKKSIISGKGAINNRISEFLFHRLSEISIPTHLIRRLNMREQLVRQLDIIPIEVVVHNIVAGTIAKRLGIARGTRLQRSIVEFFLKDDSLQDPMVTEEHITAFGWAAPQDIDDMTALALRTNDFLQGYFLGCGFALVDFKIEFGRLFDDTGEMRLLLADEISPDSMRLWDLKSKDSFDKDVFREDRGDLSVAYREVARRMGLFERDEDLEAESLE